MHKVKSRHTDFASVMNRTLVHQHTMVLLETLALQPRLGADTLTCNLVAKHLYVL